MNKLSDDLKIEIVSRLSIQMLGCLMCVSKGWHNFITSTTTSYLPVKFYGIVIREEYGKADELLLAIIWNSFGNDTKFYYPNDFGTNTKWLDYCNGLFLFWHRYQDKSLLNIKHYVVFNPLTKQYVTVDKPIPRSRDRDYAVLAYDPCRSNFFQIVRFESSTHLKVFFSETGRWVTLLYQLPVSVTEADWVKQCTYFQGALYRLSKSGHLLRFQLGVESRTGAARAEAIDLPNEIERSKDVEEYAGILNGQLSFSMSDSLKVRIWELQHDAAVGSYRWSLKYVISCSSSTVQLFKYNDTVRRVTAFHPYQNVVYSTDRHYLVKGNDIPGSADGFCLTNQTSFGLNLISNTSNRSRNRLHFHPVVLCLSQFGSTNMDNSKVDCERKFRFR